MAVEVERARRLFTVDEYARMIEAGILTKQDHVELIHGEIIEMTPIGQGHFAATTALNALFVSDSAGAPSWGLPARSASPRARCRSPI
jgi:Uma2 family endonuclease